MTDSEIVKFILEKEDGCDSFRWEEDGISCIKAEGKILCPLSIRHPLYKLPSECGMYNDVNHGKAKEWMNTYGLPGMLKDMLNG
jgi:hypothetical protein